MILRLAPVLLLFCAACAASPQATEQAAQPPSPDQDSTDQGISDAGDEGEYIVHFRDRAIDLEPYVQGFPYYRFMPDLEHQFMLYFEDTPQGQWLRHLTFEKDRPVDVEEGRKLGDIDWSTRSFRYGSYNPVLERFVFLGDEQNDEFFNLYTLDLDDGSIEALTEVDYVYGWGYSDDDRLLGYVVRHGETGPFNSCLHVRDLESGDDRQIWCDEGGDDRLTWTAVEFSPEGDQVLVRMQHDGNRNTTNIGRFDVTEPSEPDLLLERGITHYRLSPVYDSYTGDQVLYRSAQGGQDNLYRYEFDSAQSHRLTDLDYDLTHAGLLEGDDAPPLLLTLLDLPWGSIVELRDPDNGEILWTQESDDSIDLRALHQDEAILSMSSVNTPFRMDRIQLRVEHGLIDSAQERAVGLESQRFAALPQELADQIIHCDVERVEFPTFDEVDGQPRMLHAYLFTPRNPPEDHLRMVRITAFYGGGNFFRTGHQLMCEAGIATFSPSPRGSRGFGADFAALNDGDLGGDDIVDLFYAARWLEAERGYRNYQIGVHGSSHGGYSTMRALTFPPETNDHDDVYHFGFGMSHAGFSDIIHFYENCNIPDWVVQVAGDPQTEADRLIDRSPLTHVERLQAPLLLTHGSHDRRVPVEGSRHFAEAAKSHGLPVVYEEFEGQGHGISGLDNRLRYYRAVFEFLESRVDSRLQDRADSES